MFQQSAESGDCKLHWLPTREPRRHTNESFSVDFLAVPCNTVYEQGTVKIMKAAGTHPSVSKHRSALEQWNSIKDCLHVHQYFNTRLQAHTMPAKVL